MTIRRGAVGAIIILLKGILRLLGLYLTQRIIRDRCARAVPRSRKAMTERRDDKPPHQARITKTHLGFGGMHIHIDMIAG